MKKSINDIPKSRGRPRTTGRGTGLLVRMHDDKLALLDAWIRAQHDPNLSRPEAVRRLVESSLSSTVFGRPSGKAMIWIKRDFSGKTISRSLKLFEEQYESMSRPKKMLMIATRASRESGVVYACVPDAVAITYSRFRRVTENEIPTKARYVAGSKAAFKARFGDM